MSSTRQREFVKFSVIFSLLLALFVVGCGEDRESPSSPDGSKVLLSRDNAALGQYIVVFKANVTDPENSAFEVAGTHQLKLLLIYSYALKGFSAIIPDDKLEAVRQDPRVSYIEPDQVVFLVDKPKKDPDIEVGVSPLPGKGGKPGGEGTGSTQPSQTNPTGINRIDADRSPTANIDGRDERVNVDIAVIDTGIDLKHPDLNVVSNKTFVTGTKSGNDDNGHGSHVAGTAAALDNGIGVVGVAPGARLHAVKVLSKSGSGFLSWVIAGVDYVTRRGDIEVANMSLGFEGTSSALNTAISNSVASGVTYAVAAGNSSKDAATFSPANHPDVITVSAMADSNGVGGGGGSDTSFGADDTFATFSNFGSVVELAAPGVDIRSTWKGGTYNTISGTSMASPHVAGVAALYKANNPGSDPSSVRSALIAGGKAQIDPLYGFTGDPDSFPEPLVYAGTL